MIAALFVHAHKRLKILPVLPLPAGFRGAFADHDKPVLHEKECMRLLQLEDSSLTAAQQTAKYLLIFQLTTSMALCDIKTLTRHHVKRDNNLEVWYIEKVRTKHLHLPNPKAFKIVLTAQAKNAFDKLRELAGGVDALFRLTSHNNINQHYENLVKLAGIDVHTTSYTLRHSFGQLYMNHNGTFEDLGKIMGNTLKNTMKYGQITTERLAAKARELEQSSPLHQLL
ncbi:MAG: hypothetical protein EOP45_12095 [Sphingobacteriaceae bacterium]|nr:MAG: hypothetical protein EOP45_12095 [Sphingobacteriaceae bacterium]